MVAITDARGLAYDFAKRRRQMWFTAKDVSAGTYLEPAAAQSAISWLADMRLLEFNSQVRPRSYRINTNANQIVPDLVREIENALEIILQRRKAEAKARADFFAANNSQYSHQPGPPNRRRHHRNGPPPAGPAGSDDPPGDGPLGGSPGSGPRNGPQSPPSGLFNSPGPEPLSPQSSMTEAVDGSEGKSKPDQVLGFVSEVDGASMDELLQIFQMQAHSMRAMISGLRKSRNLRIELIDGRYKVVGTSLPAALH